MENVYRPNYKKVVVKLEDGNTFEGKVNISTKKRVSEFISDGSDFITLVEATSTDGVAGNLMINKRHIIWVGFKD